MVSMVFGSKNRKPEMDTKPTPEEVLKLKEQKVKLEAKLKKTKFHIVLFKVFTLLFSIAGAISVGLGVCHALGTTDIPVNLVTVLVFVAGLSLSMFGCYMSLLVDVETLQMRIYKIEKRLEK